MPTFPWNSYICGYQPARKWLKDRVDREIIFDGILHYQKTTVVSSKTAELMKILIRYYHGNWLANQQKNKIRKVKQL